MSEFTTLANLMTVARLAGWRIRRWGHVASVRMVRRDCSNLYNVELPQLRGPLPPVLPRARAERDANQLYGVFGQSCPYHDRRWPGFGAGTSLATGR